MKRSALSLIGSLVGLVYLAYLCFELVVAENPRAFAFEAAGFSVRVAALMPCALVTAAAVLLGWIGFFARKRGPMLAAAILYLAALPLVLEMFAIPLALSLLSLTDFFASLVRQRRRPATRDPAPETEGSASGPDAHELDRPVSAGDVVTDDLEADPAADIDDAQDDDVGDELGDELDDDLNDGLDDDPNGDSGDDLQLETLLEDDADGADDENRPRADGMAVFLGVFMGLVVLALIGMVAYGVMGLSR